MRVVGQRHDLGWHTVEHVLGQALGDKIVGDRHRLVHDCYPAVRGDFAQGRPGRHNGRRTLIATNAGALAV